MAKKLRSPQLGDIFAIPLPDGLFGYCHMFRDLTFGVFDFVSASHPSILELSKKPIAFWVTCFSRAVQEANWQLLGNLPFKTVQDSWPPPVREVYSDMPERCRIYYREETSDQWYSSKSVRNLEAHCFTNPQIIVERIIRQIIRREFIDPLEYSGDYNQLRQEFGEDYQAGIDKKFRGKLKYPDFPFDKLDELFPLPKAKPKAKSKKSDK